MRWVQGYLGCREEPCVVADLSAFSGTSRNCMTGTRLLGPLLQPLSWALPGDPWKFLEQILLASTEPWKPFLPPPRPLLPQHSPRGSFRLLLRTLCGPALTGLTGRSRGTRVSSENPPQPPWCWCWNGSALSTVRACWGSCPSVNNTL